MRTVRKAIMEMVVMVVMVEERYKDSDRAKWSGINFVWNWNWILWVRA